MKIDCNITKNYLSEKARMVKYDLFYYDCGINCQDCPLNNQDGNWDCGRFEYELPERAVEIVQKWSDEHQIKTYKEDFFEKFPDAIRNEEGYPRMSPRLMYGDKFPSNIPCHIAWDMVMEE